jgi:hypothetical protein
MAWVGSCVFPGYYLSVKMAARGSWLLELFVVGNEEESHGFSYGYLLGLSVEFAIVLRPKVKLFLRECAGTAVVW